MDHIGLGVVRDKMDLLVGSSTDREALFDKAIWFVRA
jgi:hypothetical protein